MFNGKTIARIEENPTDPDYGRAHDDTLLIHFTDGTAMRVTGSSYEEVSLSYDAVDDPAAYARAAQGRREAERLRRLQREERASISQEERDTRDAKRRAKMSPFELAMEDAFRGMARSFIADANRTLFGTAFTIPVGQQRTKARKN